MHGFRAVRLRFCNISSINHRREPAMLHLYLKNLLQLRDGQRLADWLSRHGISATAVHLRLDNAKCTSASVRLDSAVSNVTEMGELRRVQANVDVPLACFLGRLGRHPHLSMWAVNRMVHSSRHDGSHTVL